MTREEIIKKLNNTIDDSIAKVNGSIPATQRKMLDEIQAIVRDLDYDGNKIRVTSKNIAVIGAIKNKLRKIILDANYQDSVKEYLKTFTDVSTLQAAYFRQTSKDFKVTAVLKGIKTQAVQSTIESLTEQGLDANISSKIQDVLRTNITSGGTFKELMEQVRVTTIGTDTEEGLLDKYVKRVTTDALNQYSRNYLQIATDSLGMDWFQYSGSNIETTRCFCIAMTEKRYFHRAEIPDLLKGNFEEFESKDCVIYSRTGLPYGMIPGTNASNFLTWLAGYNCSHRALPVPTILVPDDIKRDFYLKYPSYKPKDVPDES